MQPLETRYRDIDFTDLRGDLLADYVVDATLTITNDGAAIYEEPSFPVVELARASSASL